jgi:hypothetical protein
VAAALRRVLDDPAGQRSMGAIGAEAAHRWTWDVAVDRFAGHLRAVAEGRAVTIEDHASTVEVSR